MAEGDKSKLPQTGPDQLGVGFIAIVQAALVDLQIVADTRISVDRIEEAQDKVAGSVGRADAQEGIRKSG